MSELHLFDFDGTLFRSPFPPAVWEGGWWGNEQSLSPPCVPEKPGADWWIQPVVAQAKKSIANPDVYAVMATGRQAHSGFRWRVPELLRGAGLHFDEVHLTKGDDSLPFKKRLLFNLLRRYPFIDTVRIWDDRKSHLTEFVRLVVQTGIDPNRVHTEHVRSVSKTPACGEAEDISQNPLSDPSYVAVFLDAASRARLVYEFPYLHHETKADHMTLAKPVNPDLLKRIGETVRMKVIGHAADDRIQAVVVEPTPNLTQNKVPHITISHADGVEPRESNDLLARGWEPVDGPTLTGVIDVHPRSLTSPQRVATRYLMVSRY